MLDHVTYADAAIRIILTVAAGAAIGVDRDKGGHPAGLGTTILVCLAAALAMLEANLLLPTEGKTPHSFGSLDFMRLPLGILTGMGFLGAGAILRRGDHVAGLTTAATLWVTTVIGLCFGAGEIVLGLSGTLLCVAVGVAAKRIEALIAEDQLATLIVESRRSDDILPSLELQLAGEGFVIAGLAQVATSETCEHRLRVRCRSRSPLLHMPSCVNRLLNQDLLVRVSWVPASAPQTEGGD